MTEAQALATGEIKDTPLAGLLASIHQKQLNGSVVLAETPERLHCVSFRQGYPFKARLADAEDLTGELLVELAGVAPDQIPAVLEHASSNGLLTGQAAIGLGVAQPQAVSTALIYQVLRRTARLFSLSTGTYGYYAEDFLASFGGQDNPPVDPLAIISAGVRDHSSPDRLARLVAGLQNRALKLTADAETIGRFRFNEAEAAVVAALGSPQVLTSLLSTSRQPPGVVYCVVHCLHMTGGLEVGAETAPARASQPPDTPRTPIALGTPPPAQPSPQPAPPAQAAPAAPARPSSPAPSPPAAESPSPKKAKPEFPEDWGVDDGEKSERRLEAERLLLKGDDVNYFELLGVTAEATEKEVQKAYASRARQFHPDRATGDMADLRPHMAKLFAKISVARDTLKDPAKREEYLEKVRAKQEGKRDPRQQEEELVRKLLDADEAFFKAKILTKRNKLDEAEEMIRGAVEVDPEQGDYLALQTWIEARKRPRSEPVKDLIETLKKAVEMAPKSEDAHFYLAQLLYQDGQERDALKQYKEVMDLNEHNIDAVRMVRILNKKRHDALAKRRESKSKISASNIFGSLFGDKKKK